jgi:hypothetical protein
MLELARANSKLGEVSQAERLWLCEWFARERDGHACEAWD